MENMDTIPAGKFQIVQHELNKTAMRRLDALESLSSKESAEQKDILIRLTQIETKNKIIEKVMWGLASSTGSLIVGILIWYFTKK